MNTRRGALGLAAVLTATIFTAFAAFAGVVHRPAARPAVAAATPVVRVAPAAPAVSHWSDD